MPADDGSDDGRPPSRSAADGDAVRHDWTGGEEAGAAVATAVAVATGTEVTDMVPLAHSVDTDALDGLLADGRAGGPVTVSFSYEGVDVRVTSDGEITVCPPIDE
jgi:hypothetical protein